MLGAKAFSWRPRRGAPGRGHMHKVLVYTTRNNGNKYKIPSREPTNLYGGDGGRCAGYRVHVYNKFQC